MGQNGVRQYISEQEYRDGEEISTAKHEWFEGQVYAMAGGTFNHTTLCSNISRLIGNALLKKPCKARNGEQRVKVEATGLETYPDAVIFCPPTRFTGTGDSTLLTPKSFSRYFQKKLTKTTAPENLKVINSSKR